jgi:signal transduction histidine kinase
MQRTAIILAYLFFCTNLFAQQYPFVHYTPKDGLVNSRVKKAYQDSKGRMYFLTYGGLSIYDGARFKNYTTQNGLPNDIVNDILETGDDTLLVATNSANINRIVKGKLELLKTANNIYPLVNQFYRHENGTIYISSDYGLYSFQQNNIEQLDLSGIKRSGGGQFNLGNISGIGNYLVLTFNEMNNNTGVYLYDIKKNRVCDSLTNISAYLMGKDGKKRIWISSEHHLTIIDTLALKTGKLSLIPPDKGYRQTNNYSTNNVALGKDFAWFVYRDEELRNSELHWIDEDGTLLRVRLPVQMTTSKITSAFNDRENNIWFCNDGEGVFKIVRSPLQIIERPLGLSTDGIPSNVYYDNGTTWYSTISKKIIRRTASGLQTFTSNLDMPAEIFYSKEKKLLCHNTQSIFQADLPDRGNTLHFKKLITLNDSDFFTGKPLADSGGVIIAAQKSGLGAWINNKLVYMRAIEPMEKIEHFYIDKSKRLWVVKRSLGIDVFNIHPGNPANYLEPVFHIPVDQMPGSVRSAVTDKNGLLWIGTRDNGLFGCRQKENTLEKVFHFHTGNGLSDNFVTSLACDSANNIIAGTQSGLDLILSGTANSYRIENLSRNNNLFAYIQTTWADARNSFALTSSGVILKVTATATDNKNQSPQLLLEELKVNAKTILQQQTRFSHKENNISFLVAAPSFIDEKQVRYTYLLQGSGNDRWSDTSSANSIINLTNLSSGSYLLHVKAFFHSGVYSPSELSYPFEITPPWWQTWWFRTLIGLLIIGLLIIAFRFYYRRKLEKEMVLLEKRQAIEKERTRIATDMHDDLGAGLSRIKFLSETIGIKKQQQQPIEEEVTKIREYSHEMIDKMGEIVWALNEKNDSLSDLLSYTRAYAVEYLSQNGIICTVNAPEQFPVGFVSGEFRRNIYLTVKEALHNIVKHAQATKVEININTENDLQIEINDNGSGIDFSKLRPFSNGLDNMKSRISDLKGQLEIRNGKGTTVKIAVPVSE